MVNNDGGSGPSQVFTCPICRALFRKSNVLKLVGILPPSNEATAWRAIKLTAPWSMKCIEEGERNCQSTSSFDSLPERLYIKLRALFRNSIDFERAIGGAVELYNNAARVLNDAVTQARDIKAGMKPPQSDIQKRLEARTRSVEEREHRILNSSYHNEAFIIKCVKAVRKEERLQLEMLESMVRRQNRLDRTAEELNFRQEKLEKEFRDLEESRKKMDALIKRKEMTLIEERRRVAAQRNLMMITRSGAPALGLAAAGRNSFQYGDATNKNETGEMIGITGDDEGRCDSVPGCSESDRLVMAGQEQNNGHSATRKRSRR